MANQLTPTKRTRLELDIDLRLVDLWSDFDRVADWTPDTVAAFLRAAYGRGYVDALSESEPGALCQRHGLKTPSRRR